MSMSDLLHFAARPARPTLNLATRISLWRSRNRLAELDARALEDIGVIAEEARREAARGFWDAPQTWLNR